MFGLDLLLYWLACQIWPDKDKQEMKGAEESANWIIIDGANREIGKEDWSNNTDHHTTEAPNDPPMDYDGDYYDGPEW